MRIITGILILVILLQSCAKVGAPTGGLKDVTPPRYLRGEPENRSARFTGEEITFWFDEYIQIKDLNKELLVSPPLKERPNIRVRDKSVRIGLMNELLPETTYTINFGNSLSDLNEGNLLPDFEFVFSTGEVIDSLAVTGKTLNAFDHIPLKDQEILVMLYEDLTDSAPLLKIPRYIGRANSNGLFSINNIHPDTCRIYALNDANGNLKYDPGAESIAFLDSALIISPATVSPQLFIKDTIKLKTQTRDADRTNKKVPVKNVKSVIDTNVVQGKILNAMNVTLYYFLEETNEVFLNSRTRDLPEKLFFIFSRTPHDSVRLRPLNYKPGPSWYLKETTVNRDSITYWITDSLMAKMDTLMMELSFTTTDSSGHFVLRTDTLRMRYQVSPEQQAGGRKGRTVTVKKVESKMKVSSSISNRGTQDLNRQVIFSIDKPVAVINPDSIDLYMVEDSLSTKQAFTVSTDTNRLREFRLGTQWAENTQYHLVLKPNSIRDLYGRQNDSVQIRFTTQKAEYYGRIIMNASGKHFPVILQVMDQKGQIVRTGYMKHPETITVDFVPPEQYTLKAIVDSNENGRWDTGNYLQHRQPEQVYFYKTPFQLRSNWDYELIWEIPD